MLVSSSIDILSTPSEIFAFLKSPEKAMLWQTSVTNVQLEKATDDLVGSSGRETISDGKGSLEMRATVVKVDADRLIGFHVESQVNSVEVEYSLEPQTTGVRVTQRAGIRWKFPVNLIMLFMGRKVRDGMLKQMAQELANLKRLCEASPDAAGSVQGR